MREAALESPASFSASLPHVFYEVRIILEMKISVE
jgi:hypothetical protein